MCLSCENFNVLCQVFLCCENFIFCVKCVCLVKTLCSVSSVFVLSKLHVLCWFFGFHLGDSYKFWVCGDFFVVFFSQFGFVWDCGHVRNVLG